MGGPGKPALNGREVGLIPLAAEDAGAMVAAPDAPQMMRPTGPHGRFSQQDVQAHCARVETARDRWDYGIHRKERPIGEVGLNRIDMDTLCASLRIAIWDPALRGHGLGTEAMALLVAFGFQRIELKVYAFTPAARRTHE